MTTDNVTFIIFGITGDLSKRKLIPAIYHLLKNKKISNLALIGTGRSAVTIKEILTTAKSFLKQPDQKIWTLLEERSSYQQLDFSNPEDFAKLHTHVQTVEEQFNLSGNRLFYLATLPSQFNTITENLAKSKLADRKRSGWSRVVYEKPFGSDLKSAKMINRYITRVFDETQIYRIDHYLGKEIVGNIALIRFTNRILEPLWNRNHIDSVQIVLSEKLGVEGRGNYYDRYGAVKDMVQSHMLQLLALVAMEAPRRLTGEYIRDEKALVLKKLRFHDLLLGQYEGYTTEKDVQPNSATETFAALHLSVNNKRWKDVPFYLKTGKSLDKKESSIHLKFRPVHCLLSKSCPSEPNYLTIRIQPDEGFALELYSKVPGSSEDITSVKMDFSHAAKFGPNAPEAYETLLDDAIKGDQSLFIRNDEIEYSWKIVDKIKSKKMQVHPYPKNSAGPKELELFNREHHLQWKS